ncbi:MAG: hypothetical protein KatS3mg095_0797 [Candidatus Parcubacteria bacterium]|nr:MAG: hypothetical protein KatS3mg095_0797 [Candidatus Parcubacteria bacterium]
MKIFLIIFIIIILVFIFYNVYLNDQNSIFEEIKLPPPLYKP